MVDLDTGRPGRVADPEVRAPWWAWGFVAAVPVGLLGLFCHWFSVPSPNWSQGPRRYGAFSMFYLSELAPVFLIGQGAHWFGALREWWGVPTERGWQGRALGDRVAGRVARSVARIGEDIRRGDPAGQVLRGAAAIATAVGCGALLLLGVSRWAVPNTVFDPNTRLTTHSPVHLMFGFWCALLSDLLFVVFGLIGCVPSPLRRPAAPGAADRSWWALGGTGAAPGPRPEDAGDATADGADDTGRDGDAGGRATGDAADRATGRPDAAP